MPTRRPTPAWIVCLLAMTSRSVCTLVAILAVTVIATAIITQTAVDKTTRQLWMADQIMDYVGSHSPTDEMVRQVDVKWLRAFYSGLVAKIDQPMAIGASFFAAGGAAAFILVGRKARPFLIRLGERGFNASPDPYRWDATAWLTAAVVSVLAVAVHWHTYVSIIRYDEDLASLGAGHGWWEWANNLAGWQVHVAAMFTIRLITAVFGIHTWAVRLPALITSSLATGALAGLMARRFSPMSAAVAVAVVFCVPLWAEQTTLARGYGLSFSAGVMLVIAAIRMNDEQERPRSFSVFLLMAGIFVGCLAHFFFLFMVVGLLAIVLYPQPLSRDVRWSVAFAIFVALIVPGISFALGLPAIVFQSYAVAEVGWKTVAERFELELMFRNAGPIGYLAAAATVAIVLAAMAMLPKRARTATLLTLLCAVGLPTIMKPVYLYPRFFVHLMPLIAAVVGWSFGHRRVRFNVLPGTIAFTTCIALLLASPPWKQPIFVNLLAASQISSEETLKYGQRYGIDRDLVPGVRYYLPDLRPRIVQYDIPPDDLDWMLAGVADGTLPPNVLSKFQIVRQWPGSEHTIYLLQRRKS